MIPGDLLSAFPHRQFHTLPGLLESWAALPNPNPNACVPMQGGSLYHFYDGLWYDPAERRTRDLPCERRTRYQLSQPDTVNLIRGWELHGFCLLTRPLAHGAIYLISFHVRILADKLKTTHCLIIIYESILQFKMIVMTST